MQRLANIYEGFYEISLVELKGFLRAYACIGCNPIDSLSKIWVLYELSWDIDHLLSTVERFDHGLGE